MTKFAFLTGVLAAAALLSAGGAQAAPCKDPNGKFIACPKAAPAAPAKAEKAPKAPKAPKAEKMTKAEAAPAAAAKPAPAPKAKAESKPMAAAKPEPKAMATAAAPAKPKPMATAAKPAAASVGAPTQARNPNSPVGATARCKDGTYSQSKSRSGTCAGHGGVGNWIG